MGTALAFARARLDGLGCAPATHGARARLGRFLAEIAPQAPFYREYAGRPLPVLPIVDKATVLGNFASFNTRGITLEQALTVAERAERTRDFSPTIDGVTVGLSSGTTGRRGAFLVGDQERSLWAGTVMGQLLSGESLTLLARRGLRVSLFLRANSNLYESVRTGRVEFRYHDLTVPIEHHLGTVVQSDIVVAPASVLVDLTRFAPDLRPTQVVSVAETLDPIDQQRIEHAWGRRVDQVYQATEGLLGVSCPAGRIHLNEQFLVIEPEWLDHERFVPVITDVARTTQLVVRYRLDDVLLAADGPCRCGRTSRSVAAVLGRADDVLTLSPRGVADSADAGAAERVHVYPDVLRHAIALAAPADYRVEQYGAVWRVALRDGSVEAVRREVTALARRLGANVPTLEPMPWPERDPLAKRRRIRRVA